ncbi:hypothetical protein CONLIGDRAFT_490260 [Coniochaeta ligniaria NRRL 30616]|uniref:Uncharacterized protein n=1 Tax=Coniochaeta ligniaria NRRL 30616 TaxID=1408157 RepID=A0A1J7IGJ1_9PEZI|nr:hypothetical protein CONLIGDRAFT_490260 [Coniochaeta ligniaria NRRL 30616]
MGIHLRNEKTPPRSVVCVVTCSLPYLAARAVVDLRVNALRRSARRLLGANRFVSSLSPSCRIRSSTHDSTYVTRVVQMHMYARQRVRFPPLLYLLYLHYIVR